MRNNNSNKFYISKMMQLERSITELESKNKQLNLSIKSEGNILKTLVVPLSTLVNSLTMLYIFSEIRSDTKLMYHQFILTVNQVSSKVDALASGAERIVDKAIDTIKVFVKEKDIANSVKHEALEAKEATLKAKEELLLKTKENFVNQILSQKTQPSQEVVYNLSGDLVFYIGLTVATLYCGYYVYSYAAQFGIVGTYVKYGVDKVAELTSNTYNNVCDASTIIKDNSYKAIQSTNEVIQDTSAIAYNTTKAVLYEAKPEGLKTLEDLSSTQRSLLENEVIVPKQAIIESIVEATPEIGSIAEQSLVVVDKAVRSFTPVVNTRLSFKNSSINIDSLVNQIGEIKFKNVSNEDIQKMAEYVTKTLEDI